MEGRQALPSASERARGTQPCARPPAGSEGKVQGDDDHHTRVITSAIGLAHQTFTGPRISSFKPSPLQLYRFPVPGSPF